MNRIIASILILIAGLSSAAWGATRKVQYVDTDVVGGAGDGSSWTNAYAGIATWEAQNTGLVAANQYLDVYCRGNAVDAPGVLNISGWTTSATCYINIQMDPNNPHGGIWNDSLYCLVPVGNYSGRAVYVAMQYTTLDGLQIADGGTSSTTVNLSSGNMTLRNCIIKNSSDDGFLGANNGNVHVYNNIIYNCADDGINTNTAPTAGTFYYNNTVSGCADGLVMGRSAGANYIIKNNLSTNNSESDWEWIVGSGGTVTTAANYTQDETSPDGASYQNATITFVGAANFHLAAAMSGTLLGTDLSGTFTTDIDGDTRDSWYAGADELISSSNINNWWWRRRN